MARIASEAEISKGLLYHYFPSKQDFFIATLEQAADEVRRLTEPNPALPPLEALAAGLGAFLEWIEGNALAYRRLMQGAASLPEVRELVERVRDQTARRVLDGMGASDLPRARAAVRGWLWFMDGAILDWLEHGDIERAELRELLLATLGAALQAAEQ